MGPSDPRAVVRNAADPRQVRDARKREKRLRREVLDDVRAVLAIPQGRRFIWRILEWGRIFGTSFSTEPLVTAFREGERNLAQQLLREVMEAVPDALPNMMKELAPKPVEPDGDDTIVKEDEE